MRADGRGMAPLANGKQPPFRVGLASSPDTVSDWDLFKEHLPLYIDEFWRAFWLIVFYVSRPHKLVQRVYAFGWQAATSKTIIRVLMAVDGLPLKKAGDIIQAVGNWILRLYINVILPVYIEVKNWIGLGPSKVPANKTYDLINKYPLKLIGLLDSSFDLDPHTVATFPAESPSSRTNAEVCAMAAKIVYEEDKLAGEIINNLWNKDVLAGSKPEERFKFNDNGWYNYETYGKDKVDTQAMIFKKGNAVVVAFRGTEPFKAVDWATDFNFTWWDGIPKLGRVHTGFLESLGLGFPIEPEKDSDKTSVKTSSKTAIDEDQKLQDFAEYINLCLTRYRQEAKRRDGAVGKKSAAPFRSDGVGPESGGTDETKALAKFLKKYVMDEQHKDQVDTTTPLSKDVRNKANWKDNPPLYWQIRLALEKELAENPDAKIYITGHSLGGALAAMFTALLTAEDDVMTERIGGLYTFGQPRVGDWSFAWYLHNKLNLPELRFVRLIYSNDLVPRVPFDDPVFQYKHLGPFHWSDAFYNVTVGTFNEQPALGMVTPYLTAFVEIFYNVVWNEIANALLRDDSHKRPRESAFQILARMGSVFFPRIGAHNPTNYLNAVRYGFPQGKQKKKPPTN
eukprot:TRINITY_DN1249_c0_g1_i1.p1 TRINITY_DN1249_c0_g1~~TRINITY_DN1249_c0_g1_i1.p1  ORF type:complete len:622 (+),score=157.55 TRINITY_DN1249_c0_g1_i1:301-2166(+)